ncbi:MAG: hypothetical protein RL235_400 [Chlamydiota bacterium]
MTVDSIGVDFGDVLDLGQWLESEGACAAQRQLEEKITRMLFSHAPSSQAFQTMATQLAWIGAQPENKHLLEKEILALHCINGYSVESCGFFKEVRKAGSAVGDFIADHVVEIAVGVVICATGVGIAVATGYTVSAAVGGVVVAGAGSIFASEEKPNPYIPPVPLPDPKACSQTELAIIQQHSSITVPKLDLPHSVDEILVTANGVWANGQFFPTDGMRQHSAFASVLQDNSSERSLGCSAVYGQSDWRTFHDYLSGQQKINGDILYQSRGESALILGHFDQAVHDLEKAIEANPANPLSYLHRGAAHFGLGEYDRSLEDYQRFTSQTETDHSFAVSEFCLGFAKGLPKGAYESGEGALLFLVDFVRHPIETSKQAIDAITGLVDLVRRDEWGSVAEALSPEVHQLVTEWDTLPSDQKGELAGYAVGKHGADILVPGALAKVASKSAKSAQELVAVCKNLQIVQDTLVLETAAGIGNTAKVAEVLEAGKRTAFLAEELGFTASETGQLKQAGILEATVAKSYDHVSLSMQESIALHKNARDFLKPYVKKPMPEIKVRELIHETGMPTFPRPEAIPENYIVRITDRGAGMEYVHPMNTHLSVRVMPGKPHSPYSHQQKPYVIQMKDGKAFDRQGNLVPHESPEAHIPIDEFIYI